MEVCTAALPKITRSRWCNVKGGSICNRSTNRRMNARTAITACTTIICVGSVWAVLAQRQQLAALRAESQATAISANENAAAASGNQSQAGSQGEGANSEDLLRLRNQVTRLSARTRELAGVVDENARLKSELERSRTTGPAGIQLPAGYIRKAQARLVGYNTPENTFESFLWALQNHETTALLQSLTPGAAQKLQERFKDPGQLKEFFNNMDAMPGLAIQNRKDQLDGSVNFEVEVVPGLPKETMNVHLISGAWKLDPPF